MMKKPTKKCVLVGHTWFREAKLFNSSVQSRLAQSRKAKPVAKPTLLLNLHVGKVKGSFPFRMERDAISALMFV